MKKMIAVILCLVLSASMLLCGCTGQNEEAETDPTNRTSIGTKLDPTEPSKPAKNEFVNENNFQYDTDAVSIRPRHLYWDGDTLVAECFVTNGKSTPVYNIEVKALKFSNQEGTFADGGFGLIDGLTVPAYGYTTWTFTFSGEAVLAAGADLASLRTESSVSFRH